VGGKSERLTLLRRFRVVSIHFPSSKFFF